MKFGYARVSKNDQSLDIQIQKLTLAGCQEIFQEKISGIKDDRAQLKELYKANYVQGDIFLCCKTGSFRSTHDLKLLSL